jgi:crotonobetainyl-CoA:carnitine CoA-transferase CaiB-like acyl-CoA transferase
VVAGATAFIAAMAALIGGRNGHDTGRVDTSVLEAFLCLTEHSAPSFAGGGPATKRHGVNRFGPVYPQTIFPTADGWIGVTALTPLQWQELCAIIGLPDLAQDPRYETTDLRMAAADELDALLAPAFHKLKAGDLLLEGQRRRVPLAPVPTMAEVLETPHWRERNSFRRIAGLVPFEAPAMPFRLHARSEGATPAGTPGRAPLAGIRVLDLSMGWSGPLAARHFADLGAEVIKIEGCSHIDWWRGWNALVAADPPPYEIRANFNAVNRNKRGIAIELRDRRGADILRRLAVDADVLIENYAPGVLSRLGFSPEAMAKINPRISYISMGAFGSAGPWSRFRAYGSTTEQAAGMPFLQGAGDWTPTMQHTAYGDPIAGIYAAAALLTALWGRARTGGTTIDLSQVECLFQLAADGLIAQSVTGEPPPRKGSARATSLFRGCLRCNGTEDWLAVDIDRPDSLAALSQIIGMDKSSSPEQIEPLLANWAARRGAVEAAEALQHAGISAAPVLPATGLLTDPHLIAIGFWQRAERRHVGMHVLPRAPYALDGVVPPIRSPAPTLGQHNADVLQQILHMSRPKVEALERAGIIGTVAI